MSFESPRFPEPPDEGGGLGDSAADDDDDPLAPSECGDDVGPGTDGLLGRITSMSPFQGALQHFATFRSKWKMLLFPSKKRIQHLE